MRTTPSVRVIALTFTGPIEAGGRPAEDECHSRQLGASGNSIRLSYE